MYKLLLARYPFETSFPDVNDDTIGLIQESLMRFNALQQSVDYSALDQYPDMVDLLSAFFVVENTARLGYGPAGSLDVASHSYFAGIDWVNLEKKKVRPPAFQEGDIPIRSSCPAGSLRRVLRRSGQEKFMEFVGDGGGTLMASSYDEVTDKIFEFWE